MRVKDPGRQTPGAEQKTDPGRQTPGTEYPGFPSSPPVAISTEWVQLTHQLGLLFGLWIGFTITNSKSHSA